MADLRPQTANPAVLLLSEGVRVADDFFVYGRDSLAARQHFARVQKGRCAICQRRVESLALDHEHSESSLCRGLLCSPCNMALGLFEDDLPRLAAAITYLAAHAVRNDGYAQTEDAEQRRLRVETRRLTSDELDARNEKIRRLFEHDHRSTQSLAIQFDLTVSQVNRILARFEG